jgi:hypothetical protein
MEERSEKASLSLAVVGRPLDVFPSRTQGDGGFLGRLPVPELERQTYRTDADEFRLLAISEATAEPAYLFRENGIAPGVRRRLVKHLEHG